MSSSNPTYYTPEFLGEDRSGHIIANAVAFLVLDTFCYVLRLFARRKQEMGWTWADIFMPISWLLNVGLCTVGLVLVRFGAGKHEASLAHDDIESFLKTFYYALPIMYLTAVVFSKLAVLELYLHVFLQQRLRIVCYVCGVIIVLNCVINVPIEIWQCTRPYSTLWHPGTVGDCINIRDHAAWASFANIITDVVMILLPIPMIMTLPSSIGARFGIYFTFLIGNLGLLTAIGRFVEIYSNNWSIYNRDPTWKSYKVIVWSTVEPSVYHLAACFITFRPLIRSTVKAYEHCRSSNRVSKRLSQMIAKRRHASMLKKEATLTARSGSVVSAMTGDGLGLVELVPSNALSESDNYHNVVRGGFAR